MDAILVNKNLSEKEKEAILREILGKDYTSVGNNLPVLKNVIDIVGHVDTTFTLAELIPIINSTLAGSRIIVLVSSGASVFSIFMFPVAAMISVINAYQVGYKMYAFRSIAYTFTAFAFNKPIPRSSRKILWNMSRGIVIAKKDEIVKHHEIWAQTSKKVITKLNSDLLSKNIPKDAMEILLRAIANDNEQKLCELILKGFEKELPSTARMVWRSNYSVKFPN